MQETQVLETLKVNSYVASMEHDVFIDETIEEEAYYRSVISTLNRATEKDTIRFTISSNGGFLGTAMVLIHAMDTCPARKIGILSGNVKSAATLIALHCDDWQIGTGCDWMAHTASFGLSGSANSIQKYHDHEQKRIKSLLEREYAGFYTEEEIEDIAKGNDSLLMPDEVQERLQNFADYRQKQQEAAIEEVVLLQTEQSSEMEKVLHKELINKGEFTVEEIALAEKVNEAVISLDESLNDDEFKELMEKGIPPESLDDEPEKVNIEKVKPDHKKDVILQRKAITGEVYNVCDNGEEYRCVDNGKMFFIDTGLLEAWWKLEDLKLHCDTFGIEYEKDIEDNNILIKKIIEDAEKFWKENAL